MKISILVTVVALLAVSSSCSQHLRSSNVNHEFLDFSNPLQLASLMSGDYVSMLPSFIQPLARKVLGQEEQSGASGFLSKAQSILGGNNGPTGGLLGSLGGLFGQTANQGNQDVSNVLSGLSGALGQNTNSNSGSNPLAGLSGLLGNFGANFHQ